MDAVEPQLRISKKKLSSVTFPEEIVRQYSRISHLLSHDASRKWLLYEWKYDEIEDAFFHKCRTFEMSLTAKFPHLKTRDLTQAEWRVIRQMILQRKCRRFSTKFITEQRIELEKYRCNYRILQENNRHDQLVKLNGFHDDVDGFVSILNSQQSQNNQLFRLFVEVKKVFAAKSALVMKLREINNNRVAMQQQQQQHQQHAIFNGNLNIEPDTMTSTTAIKVIAEIRDCNKEIVCKLNRMFCFRTVKDALLCNAVKRKNIAMPFSPAYFLHISSVQLYESQQLYQSRTFITTTDVQTLLDTLLTQVLIINQHESMLKMAESVEKFTDDLIKEQMPVVNAIVSIDCMSFLESDCLPKFFEILNVLKEFY